MLLQNEKGDDGEMDNEAECVVDEACDYRGISGWGAVDTLADCLLQTSGIAISSAEAERIVSLYEKLSEYDKRPITYDLRSVKPARGRWGRSRPYRTEENHTITAMKR